MLGLEGLVIVVALCTALSIMSYVFKLLTMDGSITAFVVGILIGVLGSIEWLLILVIFTLVGFLVTKYKIRAKMSKGLQEGFKGERGYKNVLGSALVPLIITILSFAAGMETETLPSIAYLSAVSVAASDTVASEMGVLSPDAYLITTFEPVSPGTDGGVSVYGTTWALLGAIFSSVVGWAFLFPADMMSPLLLIPIFAGFVGCLIDSLIGATLERRGIIGKLGNNIASMGLGAMLAVALLLVL